MIEKLKRFIKSKHVSYIILDDGSFYINMLASKKLNSFVKLVGEKCLENIELKITLRSDNFNRAYIGVNIKPILEYYNIKNSDICIK